MQVVGEELVWIRNKRAIVEQCSAVNALVILCFAYLKKAQR